MNKSFQLLLAFLCFAPTALWAQVNATEHMPLSASKKKWKIASLGLHIGSYGDSYADMTYTDALRMVENTSTFSSIDLEGYELSDYAVVLSGTNIGAYIELHPFNKNRQDFHLGHRLRLGVSANLNRELVVDYTSYEEPSPSDYYYYSYNHIGYCIVENEVQFSASYTVSYGVKRWSFYGGAGTNVGGTYNNFLMILSSDAQLDGLTETSRNSVYTRLYGIGGIDFRISSKLNVYMEVHKGGGMQFVDGASNQNFGTAAFQMGMKYRLMK